MLAQVWSSARRATLRATVRASEALDAGAARLMERRLREHAPPPREDARARLRALADHYRAVGDGLFVPPPAADANEHATEHAVEHGPHGSRVFDLSFASPYVPSWPGYVDEFLRHRANLTVHARHWTLGAGRPVVIVIHGWAGGNYWVTERGFVVGYWLRQGFDVVAFTLPYHGRRAPEVPGLAPRSGALFPGGNVMRTNEAFAQAISDLRALAALLRARGAPAIAVLGMSLGGYTAALWASLDDDLAAVVPMIPAVAMDELIWRHGAETPARRQAQKAGIDRDLLAEVFAVHAPLARPARVPAARLMVVAGRGDQITPPAQAEALAAHWGCALTWFPGGHLAQIGRGDALRAVRQHLATHVLGQPT